MTTAVERVRAGRDGRIAALRAALGAAGLDGILVSSLPNIRYLVGFTGTSGLLLVTRTDIVFISDFRYRVQGADECGDVARVEVDPVSTWGRLWAILPTLEAADQLAFESSSVSHQDYQRIVEAGARWHWRPTIGMVEALRVRKDPAEVALIRDAVALAEGALHQAIAAIRAGVSEATVAARLEWLLRDLGSEGHPFETIVASGERSALPHARASRRELSRGDLVIVDFGAIVGGYCSDITRTFCIGPASGRQREAYEVVRESNGSASAGVRAKMRGGDADAIARDYIARRGLGEEFGHSLGHGIGLEVHEAPRLSRTADAPLPEHAVVTIEPGVYREGWGGVRIEDDVYLGLAGPEILTTFTRDLIEL